MGIFGHFLATTAFIMILAGSWTLQTSQCWNQCWKSVQAKLGHICGSGPRQMEKIYHLSILLPHQCLLRAKHSVLKICPAFFSWWPLLEVDTTLF